MKRKFALMLVCMLCLNAVPAAADGVKVVVNGETVEFDDAQPVIINSRTMIPLRGVFEKLGYDVFWKAETKTAVIVAKNSSTIRIKVGDEKIYKGDEQLSAETVPQIIGGRMYLPLRAVGEAAGLKVQWNAADKTVYIGDGVIINKAEDRAEAITDEEIRSVAVDLFTTAILETAADEYDDYIEKGHTADEYVQAVTAFIANESIGLNGQYKTELSELLESAADYRLENEMSAFADKMENLREGDIAQRKAEIISAADDKFIEEIELVLEKAGSDKDIQSRLENAVDVNEYITAYADMIALSLENLDKIKTESRAEENAVKLYKYSLEIVNRYIDYIQGEDFEMTFAEVIM